MPFCVDCGKTLTQRHYERCKSCARKGKLNPHSSVNLKKHNRLTSNWKGGISKLHTQIYNSKEYKGWRTSIFQRDSFQCAVCCSSKDLRVHHIKHFIEIMVESNITSLDKATNVKELWETENGVTLCHACHMKIHKAIGFNSIKKREKHYVKSRHNIR